VIANAALRTLDIGARLIASAIGVVVFAILVGMTVGGAWYMLQSFLLLILAAFGV
jgi:hypothetical protein